jgi:hypothetical protein
VTEYREAPVAAAIAEQLIGQHHTHLASIRVEFVFRDKANRSHGRVVLGKARKVDGLNAFLARALTWDPDDVVYGEPFFLIELALDEWARLDDAGRRALVDHELCHCLAEWDDEKGEHVLGTRGHDIEEFAEIVDRHGLWKADLAAFAESVGAQIGHTLDNGGPLDG